ncbi:MAG: GTPase Era [Bacteroidetes bacterium]|nr:GTPase Era [Bacteroidota bacterium]
MAHKSGFVNIIGNPNVGKSTLMNALVGEKLAIITSKVQTTRHRLKGIVNGDNFQIVYSDTPGIVDPHYKLHEYMMKFIDSAMIDADIFLLVTDVGDQFENQKILDRINESGLPIIVIINKIDLSDQKTVVKLMTHWRKQLINAEIIPVSALNNFNIESVFNQILDKLPENPPYFPKDELTDKSQRFFVSEFIREKILLYYQKEIPYSVEVVVETFKEEEKIIRILALIFVARDTQKAIIIGHKGEALKKVGIEARKDIEEFVGKKVYLELSVKVNKDWRDKDLQLRRFGYIQ